MSYLNVVIAQAAALSNEQTAVDLLGRRMVASVLLVKALGGGWNVDDLPSGRRSSRSDGRLITLRACTRSATYRPAPVSSSALPAAW